MAKTHRMMVGVDALWFAMTISSVYKDVSISTLSEMTNVSVADINRILRFAERQWEKS